MSGNIQLVPLPERLRPRSLDEYVGQEHLVGKNAVLRTMIETGNVSRPLLLIHQT